MTLHVLRPTKKIKHFASPQPTAPSLNIICPAPCAWKVRLPNQHKRFLGWDGGGATPTQLWVTCVAQTHGKSRVPDTTVFLSLWHAWLKSTKSAKMHIFMTQSLDSSFHLCMLLTGDWCHYPLNTTEKKLQLHCFRMKSLTQNQERHSDKWIWRSKFLSRQN